RVDFAALRRGRTTDGEVCEIPGIGPIPVATAREMLGNALIKIVVTDGVDVSAIVHPSRAVRAPLRTALAWRSDECEVVGCHRTYTETHHVKPFAESRHTCLDELASACRHHHHLVHDQGWN